MNSEQENQIRKLKDTLWENSEWYRSRSTRFKYFYYSLAAINISLPVVLLLSEKTKSDYNQSIIIGVILLITNGTNMIFRPFETWKQFKSGQIRLRSLLFQLETDVASIPDASRMESTKKLLHHYTLSTETLLLELADTFFAKIKNQFGFDENSNDGNTQERD